MIKKLWNSFRKLWIAQKKPSRLTSEDSVAADDFFNKVDELYLINFNLNKTLSNIVTYYEGIIRDLNCLLYTIILQQDDSTIKIENNTFKVVSKNFDNLKTSSSQVPNGIIIKLEIKPTEEKSPNE